MSNQSFAVRNSNMSANLMYFDAATASRQLSQDQALRLVTGSLFGMSAAANVEGERFVWEFPTGDADRHAGGICAQTGYWAPGHCMVTVDGLRFIRDFAPAHVEKFREKE